MQLLAENIANVSLSNGLVRIELTTTGRKLENLRENPRVALAVQAAEAGGRMETMR